MMQEQDAIGVQLRAARMAAGLSLDDVVFQTQLPRKVLFALENDDFSVFTSPLYAKSFLSQYSAFLGVDADPWIDAIEPGRFVPANGIATILDGPAVAVCPAPAPAGRRGGWLAVLGLLAVSFGIVAATIKGYGTFEKRFGMEPPSTANPRSGETQSPAPEPTALSNPQLPEDPPPDARQAAHNPKSTASQTDEEILTQAPPRAIIVR